jgi:hypothetical protein
MHVGLKQLLVVSGLKNSFRLLVSKVRVDNGLDADASNAPPEAMLEPEDIVQLPPEVSDELCYAFQHAALTHVEDRLYRALQVCHRLRIYVKALVVVGGVAANQDLRRRLSSLVDWNYNKAVQLAKDPVVRARMRPLRVVCPPVGLCTDNGAMIAWAAVERFSLGYSDGYHDDEDDHEGGNGEAHVPNGPPVRKLEVIPRWPIGHLIYDESGSAAKATTDKDGDSSDHNGVIVYERKGTNGGPSIRVTTTDIQSMMKSVENASGHRRKQAFRAKK